MSRRTERIAHLVRNVLAEAIRAQLSDPRIEPLTTVTRVAISPDLSVAHVHVSVLGTDERRALCVEALRSASGRLRALLAERLVARQIPRLEFHLDDSIRRGIETVETLDRLMSELEASGAAKATADESPPKGEH